MVDAVNVVDIMVNPHWDNKLKLECVGHYQKRVGTQLRNLKKKDKGLGGMCRLTDTTTDWL